MELEAEIKKIKFQISLIGEAIRYNENPLTSLVIELDWSEEDLEAAHDCFEQAETVLNNNPQDFNNVMFEKLFKEKIGRGVPESQSDSAGILSRTSLDIRVRSLCKFFRGHAAV